MHQQQQQQQQQCTSQNSQASYSSNSSSIKVGDYFFMHCKNVLNISWSYDKIQDTEDIIKMKWQNEKS